MKDRSISRMVRERFASIARDPAGERRFRLGRESARALGYDPAALDALPEEVVARFAGVGRPLGLGPLPAGARVLDLGAGAGLDALLAGRAGARVCGLDFAPEMVAVAERARRHLGLDRVRFVRGDAAAPPFATASFEVALTNGVVNLCPDKDAVFRALARVVRPGGRLYAADVVLEEGVDEKTLAELGTWSD